VLATARLDRAGALEEAARGGAQAGGRGRARFAPVPGPTWWCPTWPRWRWRAARDDAILDTWIFAGDDHLVAEVWSAGRHIVTGGRHVARDAVAARFRKVMAGLRDAL
jgi:formimidoylglutamate deiminase